MEKLSKFDKQLISRRGSYIRELNLEKKELINRMHEIDNEINEYREYNREILLEEEA